MLRRPQQPRRKTGKTIHRLALAILSALFVGAAISPGIAADKMIDVDRGALALIATFSILFLALIFEVWRLTRLNRTPKPMPSHDIWQNISHE